MIRLPALALHTAFLFVPVTFFLFGLRAGVRIISLRRRIASTSFSVRLLVFDSIYFCNLRPLSDCPTLVWYQHMCAYVPETFGAFVPRWTLEPRRVGSVPCTTDISSYRRTFLLRGRTSTATDLFVESFFSDPVSAACD